MKYGVYIALFLLFAACGTKKAAETESVQSTPTDYSYIEKFHKALRLKQKGQYPEAIAAFEACKALRPTDDAVYYALAELYLLTQQMSKSSEAINLAFKLYPKKNLNVN
jgi:tetratricopeptide (TPR) repeat protein